MQIDFTEGRLAIKIDPTGTLLTSFIDLNNLALARFTAAERERIGVHTCPGGDLDSTHSADVDYAELLPSLLLLNLTNYYIALAGEKDRRRVLERDPRAPEARASGSSWASSPRSIRTSRPPRRSATASSRRRSTSRSRSSARPTTAASLPSATTRRPRATLPSRRSPPAFAAPRSPPKSCGPADAIKDDEDQLLRSVALQNAQTILRARQRAEQELVKTKEALEEERRILELLNQTGAKLASKLDLPGVIQTVTDAATQLCGAQFGAFFYAATGGEPGPLSLYALVGRAPRGVRAVRRARPAAARAHASRRGDRSPRRRPRRPSLRARSPVGHGPGGARSTGWIAWRLAGRAGRGCRPPAGAQLPRRPGDGAVRRRDRSHRLRPRRARGVHRARRAPGRGDRRPGCHRDRQRAPLRGGDAVGRGARRGSWKPSARRASRSSVSAW